MAFSDMPYEQVSLDQIAQDAGVSKGLPYHYFGTKRALYRAVVHEVMGRLSEIRVPNAGSGQERAVIMMQLFVSFAEREARLYRDIVLRESVDDEPIADALERVRSNMRVLLLRLARIEEPDDAIILVLRGWMASADTIILRWLEERPITRCALIKLLVASWDATAEMLRQYAQNHR